MKIFRNLLQFGLLSFVVGCCAGAHVTPVVEKSSSPVEQSTRQQRIEFIRDATIAIVKPFDDAMVPVCTGVWISKNLILTAEHCVEDEESLDYSTPEGFLDLESHKAFPVAKSKKFDLALLMTVPDETPDHNIVVMKEGSPVAGDPVDIIGHPIGYPWTYSTGYVSSVRGIMNGPAGSSASILQISAPVWMGNSGGGAFDTQGRLAGICSWVSKAGPHLSFFIHKDSINEFLEESLTGPPL